MNDRCEKGRMSRMAAIKGCRTRITRIALRKCTNAMAGPPQTADVSPVSRSKIQIGRGTVNGGCSEGLLGDDGGFEENL